MSTHKFLTPNVAFSQLFQWNCTSTSNNTSFFKKSKQSLQPGLMKAQCMWDDSNWEGALTGFIINEYQQLCCRKCTCWRCCKFQYFNTSKINLLCGIKLSLKPSMRYFDSYLIIVQYCSRMLFLERISKLLWWWQKLVFGKERCDLIIRTTETHSRSHCQNCKTPQAQHMSCITVHWIP